MHYFCLSSIILSPREPGDICIEPGRIATSERDFIVREGEPDVRQSRRTARPFTSTGETTQIALSPRRGGGSGARQPRTAQPPPPASAPAGSYLAFGSHHLCRLQRPSPVRKAL